MQCYPCDNREVVFLRPLFWIITNVYNFIINKNCRRSSFDLVHYNPMPMNIEYFEFWLHWKWTIQGKASLCKELLPRISQHKWVQICGVATNENKMIYEKNGSSASQSLVTNLIQVTDLLRTWRSEKSSSISILSKSWLLVRGATWEMGYLPQGFKISPEGINSINQPNPKPTWSN